MTDDHITDKLLQTNALECISVKETDSQTKLYTFRAATTVPDRVRDDEVSGEILTKSYLEKVKDCINDTSKVGGKLGAYRTVSLFHDRVYEGNQKIEEAGYIMPNARVVEMKEFPGHYALEVDVEVNEMYQPHGENSDYTPDKIKYKIDKGAIGLSIEYYPLDKEYQIAVIDNERFRVVDDFAEFTGFGFARANVIGNTTAVAIKESISFIEGKTKMAEVEQTKTKEQEQIEQLQAEVKEIDSLKAQLKEAESTGAEVEKLQAKIKELEDNSIPAADVKELLAKSFESISINNKVGKNTEDVKEMKPALKEIKEAIDNNDWVSHSSAVSELVKENVADLERGLKEGIRFEDYQTLSVKCVGSSMKVVPTAKTKDVVDNSSMDESTYTQTNAMYADRYVAQITETFLMDDNLLKAMPKEQHIGGNDNYQWKIWVDFIDASSSSLAVNPDTLAVNRTKRKFEKLQTPIKEYRDGVEVSDFAQYHSRAAIGDLLGIEVERAAQAVTQSMAADIFKENADGDGVQFLGLEAVADSTGNTTLYGKTRTTTNRLKADSLADTYVTTSEGIDFSVVRAGYEKVLAQGSSLASLAIVAHPTQVRRLFDTAESNIDHPIMTMAPAPASFGFNRTVIPMIDGIPIIRDYNCSNDSFYVVDLSQDKGFVLVVSKPLGMRGLAKVGTSESAYVNFYGAAVYKAPRNVFLHDNLTV